MNDINRMRKLAGMLTESVAIVPGIGNQSPNVSQPPVNETDDSNIVAQKLARLEQMSAGMVDKDEALVAISRELSDEGYDNDDIASIMGEIEIQLHDNYEREEFLNGDDNEICISCNGSGEGQYDGTRCSSCGGSGVDRGSNDDDDFDPPDDEPDDYMGPFEEAVMEEDDESTLQNGYNDVHDVTGADLFPNGAESSVTADTGASGARQGDNPEQKKIAVAETHKELVYNYRKFLKESAKK